LYLGFSLTGGGAALLRRTRGDFGTKLGTFLTALGGKLGILGPEAPTPAGTIIKCSLLRESFLSV